MALKLNKTLTTQSNLILPKDNVIVTSVHLPQTVVTKDDEDKNVYTRRITYDLNFYVSTSEVLNVDNDRVKGGVKEIPSGYEKIMTPAEYFALLADGSLAEVWLKQYVDGIMGAGTATIFDPYV